MTTIEGQNSVIKIPIFAGLLRFSLDFVDNLPHISFLLGYLPFVPFQIQVGSFRRGGRDLTHDVRGQDQGI
jgi:hypothetical protein